jgi:hypothetical protein
MEAMWIAFFGLLLAGELPDLYESVRDLPLAGEIVAWIAFFPWMLGMAVWTSSWSEAVRVLLVLSFAIAWSLIFVPRKRATPAP